MKKLLFVAICVAGIVAGNAQGTYSFSNAAGGGLITVDGAPAPAGTTVELLSGGSAIASTTVLSAGLFIGGDGSVDGVTGVASFAIRATTAGGDTATSDLFDISLGGGGTPPALPGGLGNFPGLDVTTGGGVVDPPVDPVDPEIPEPSTIALGALGAALLFFRRRK